MARAFARRGHDDETRYTAHLDADERGVVAELLRQVRLLIAPGGRGIQTETAGDEFDAIVAGLGADFGATPTVPDSPEGLGGRGLPDEPRDPAGPAVMSLNSPRSRPRPSWSPSPMSGSSWAIGWGCATTRMRPGWRRSRSASTRTTRAPMRSRSTTS